VLEHIDFDLGFVDARNARRVFAAPTVEKGDFVAGSRAQHVDRVVRRFLGERG
jgi:hypothetical protein